MRMYVDSAEPTNVLEVLEKARWWWWWQWWWWW